MYGQACGHSPTQIELWKKLKKYFKLTIEVDQLIVHRLFRDMYPPVSAGIHCRIKQELNLGHIRRATQLFGAALITTRITAHPKRNAQWDAGNRWIDILAQ